METKVYINVVDWVPSELYYKDIKSLESNMPAPEVYDYQKDMAKFDDQHRRDFKGKTYVSQYRLKAMAIEDWIAVHNPGDLLLPLLQLRYLKEKIYNKSTPIQWEQFCNRVAPDNTALN